MDLKNFRFDSLPRSTQIAVFSVLMAAVSFAFYWYFVRDLTQEHKKLQTEVARLEKTVAKGAAVESRLKRFKDELVQLEQRLVVLQSILPAQKETPTVLRSVQQMAASSNLKINKFTPQAVVPRAFYSDWPILIEVEGNYDGLGLFFEKVGQATRIIDVDTISIKALENSVDRSKTLNASCTATTFVFREDQVVEPEAAVKGKKKEKKL